MKKFHLANDGRITVEVAIFLPAYVVLVTFFCKALLFNVNSHIKRLDHIVEANEFSRGERIKLSNDNPIQVEQFRRGINASIWSLEYKERGVKLQNIFGRNLPNFFPVLTSYQEGIATIITSIDVSLKTYQNKKALKRELESIVSKLSIEQDYEYKDIKIKNKEIKKKRIIVIVPENELNEMQKEIFDNVKREANKNGIEVSVIEYEKKES